MQEKDLIVLGGGPGGYVAAIRASQLGRKVTLVERESLGGICLNWGCIPSKALLQSAAVYHNIKRSKDFGFSCSNVKIDFPTIIDQSRQVASRLSNGVSFLMKKNKVEVIKGEGKLKPGNKLTVKEKGGKESTFSYKDIIIATGARSRPLPGVEVDGEIIHDYRTMLVHKKLPQKLLVVGAGAIGVEFAYFFSTLGTQVTLVEMMDQILPLEDKEVSKELEKIFTKRGLIVKTSSSVSNIKKGTKTVSALIKTKEGEEKWSGDALLIAIGVVPNSDNIGLEAVGIKTERGFIVVDKYMNTNVPDHYAIGDVIGPPLLAHVASHEGIIAAESACGVENHGMSYENIPACTYCQPQVASIGFTEEECKKRGLKYRVGKFPFSASGKAIAIREQEGFTKVLVDEELGEVLGVHIIHAEATELISEAAVIRSHEGVAASVLETVHPHPTLSETVMEAMALALGRPINF
ncbi:MAG: dihydrolipoyl dehydrogenase [Candidatus Dadabacteria bacterium]|nr:MAG: dihydrolipoyl dehydrogenase [Candidatus Dadabacteria bacterium]